MEHNFIEYKEPVQWGQLGLPETSACSYYRCTDCKQTFEHHYHTTPSIYDAIKEANIDINNCKGKKGE